MAELKERDPYLRLMDELDEACLEVRALEEKLREAEARYARLSDEAYAAGDRG